MTSSLARACVLLSTTAVVGLAVAGTASAHVHADAPGATQGGYAVVTFRVPTESATATTTGFTVTLPTDAKIASLSSEQLAGWSSTVATSANGTPTAVTWRAATGSGIPADQFGLFSIDVGPLPTTSSLTFDATQDYSDGTTVAWDQAPNADGSEPEHPAPEITLAASTGTSGDDDAAPASGTSTAGSSTTGSTVTASASPVAASSTGTSDTTARWLGAGGLLLGALGLGLGGGAALQARRARP